MYLKYYEHSQILYCPVYSFKIRNNWTRIHYTNTYFSGRHNDRSALLDNTALYGHTHDDGVPGIEDVLG